ncbi:MAG: prepilin-type N-terminal cleavage/methylation domain-containing protein [Gammaproteobacteria bacterium]|nr:prepilin-type N-terminal cleavage/methylation domain-containing protein [Gammaproteobacteria bacterium]
MKKSYGVTLIELIIAIVIISLATAGIMLLISDTTRRSGDPLLTEQASAIAQAYMEEIQTKQFCDPDWDHDGVPPNNTDCPVHCVASACTVCKGLGSGWTTETRPTYDDVCDYSAISGEVPTSQNGATVNGLGQYQVSVSIDSSASATIGPAGNVLSGNAGQVVLINVTVSHPAMENDVIVSGYRSNF